MRMIGHTGLVLLTDDEWEAIRETLLKRGYRSTNKSSKGNRSHLINPSGIPVSCRCYDTEGIAEKDEAMEDGDSGQIYLEAFALADCPEIPGALHNYELWEALPLAWRPRVRETIK